MERGDIITLVAGIVIVFVIAVVFKTGIIVPAQDRGEQPKIPVQVTTVPRETTPTETPAPATTTIPVPANPVPVPVTYSKKPLAYPVIRLPDSMETFGGSDIPWKDPDVVIFAVMQGSRGGLSEEFNVPYELWGLNISVEAWTKPQYARFGMVLCSAKDGNVIEGVEILNGGTAFRNVQVSGSDMYLIIDAENVDRFRIDYITPRNYYNRTQRTISVQTGTG